MAVEQRTRALPPCDGNLLASKSLCLCELSWVSPISLQCFWTLQGEKRCSKTGVNPKSALLMDRSLFYLEGLWFGPWGIILSGAVLS